MTRGKLFKICRPYITGDYDNDAECNGLVSRILTALEAERVGEVVLCNGDIKGVTIFEEWGGGSTKNIGKKGSLIFREDK